MQISVVICTRNRPDLIGQSLTSVLANAHPNFDVIVVDQSDDGRTGEVVRGIAARDSRLRYLYTMTAGLSRAYNLGIRETSGEVLAFTDDDCVAADSWLEAIAAAFEHESEADLLYGQVLVPDELADRAEQVPQIPFTSARRLSRADGFRVVGMGANFAARRRLFERIGGFDEVLGGGGPLRSSQDFDLLYRAYIAGTITLLRPDVIVDHYGIRSWEQWPAMMRAYGTGDGAFYSKHVRCGDLLALRLMLSRFGRIAARELLLRLGVRPKPSQAGYLQGCLDGILGGLKFGVDRRRRLYVQPLELSATGAQ
jgi:glycosyltransferase involved in cell wall biosynthesis